MNARFNALFTNEDGDFAVYDVEGQYAAQLVDDARSGELWDLNLTQADYE